MLRAPVTVAVLLSVLPLIAAAQPGDRAECRRSEGPAPAVRLEWRQHVLSHWNLTLIRDSTPTRAVGGQVVFYPDFDALPRILGRAQIALDSVGGTYEPIFGSFDSLRHDVLLANDGSGTTLVIGRGRAAHGDGGGTFLDVNAQRGDTLTGTWSARYGVGGQARMGYFCLVRSEPRYWDH
jgi:hypothetical protein